jgi:phosphate acyltransferase
MRIIVDAMGTDARPTPDVAGAVMAAHEWQYEIVLVGRKEAIDTELKKHDTRKLRLTVINTTDEILMADRPSVVSKEKQDSSMHIGMKLVKNGEADAFVTAGNTGAAYAIAMLNTLRRISGVKRPALSGIFPIDRQPIIFLDIGANADARPEWLSQFAVMGNIYAKNALRITAPRVGILSNGEEEGKGNQLVQEAGALIAQLSLNYVGNVEPRYILQGGVDVVVSDGFTGNILIKTFEASVRYLTGTIRDELRADVFSSIGGLLAKPAFKRARRRLDTSEVGGAPLLGVDGVVIICHGSSDERAIKNAIHQAARAAEGQVIDVIRQELAISTPV